MGPTISIATVSLLNRVMFVPVHSTMRLLLQFDSLLGQIGNVTLTSNMLNTNTPVAFHQQFTWEAQALGFNTARLEQWR